MICKNGLSLLLACVLLSLSAPLHAQKIHHYMFVNRDRQRLSDSLFLNTNAFDGAQVKFTWKELEPEKGQYDFSSVRRDLDFLASRGKKLFLQVQDVSFDTSIVNVPIYLIREKEFHGGMDYQYGSDSLGRLIPGGWVARRWDPAVQVRLHLLFDALGKAFDGQIEGVTLPETSVEFGDDGRLFPSGFSFDRYRDAVIENMKALKGAFPKSVAMIYANFMPGERHHSYLQSIYREAKESGVGLGGPDLLPYEKGHMNNGYRFIKQCKKESVPSGIAVQEGNYRFINPETGVRVTVHDLIEFADRYLGVEYIFWSTEEPFFARDVIPVLTAGK